ncbi:predicted protein [Naegleria gruberi]|uniref:Predicted protein n=1 Tax=Naegleria gruberi TaxID=5762 RepID=D2VEN1_NAEGR|nr:uncharacterized protein NAEGRDRAFT_67334 [Naegleria gruberi]EFC44530.1 predicted protein [Naegleria gruberi]|eukprot:XP_002677274.1 predicted protein [Naegleria gruberi strain NEG-M]
MQDITRRRIDMQYFDEFIKLHEKHAKQFDPLIQELQFGSKPQHNVDRLLRRKVSEINYDNSNQQEDAISYMSGGMSGGMSDNHRFSVCSVNDNEINTSTEITVSSPTTTSLLDSSNNNNNNTIINEYSNDDNNDNNNNNNTTDNSAVLYHSNSTLSNNSTSDNNNLFSTITEQLIKLNPNRVTPLVKEHVIEEIGNTKYTTLVFNPLYGLKDLPTTRKYRLQYIDEFKDWNESSVNDEYSNFLKNFSDKFGIPNEINTSSSPSRSSNADKSNPYNNNNNNNTNTTTTTENDKKRRSLFFWK